MLEQSLFVNILITDMWTKPCIQPAPPGNRNQKISTYSSKFSFISLQSAESKPPSKPVKKESKKEKKEMSLLDLDDCEYFHL